MFLFSSIKNSKNISWYGFCCYICFGIYSPINFLLEKFVLKQGALTWISDSFIDVDLSFLSFIMFIAIIASMVQLVEMIVEKISPALYGSLGIFTSNCC